MADMRQGAEEFEILDEQVETFFGPGPNLRREGAGERAAAGATAETSAAQTSTAESRCADGDEGRSQPIFVLSCHRAGSTLLRFILDTHPDIYCPPELFLGQAAHSLAIFLCGLEGRGAFYEAEGRFFVSDTIAETLRQIISDRMTEQTRERGKRLWCEKTPQNVYHLRLLDLLFPRAKHICLHRHALDVVSSATKMAGRIGPIQKAIYKSSGHVLTGTIRWWCEMTRASLEFEQRNPDRCFRIRYEDVVTAPERVLAPLFSFLGVSWDERMLEEVFSASHDEGYEDPNIRFTGRIHAGSIGSGSSLSLEGVPDEVLSTMHQLLSELGYPEVSAPPTEAPAAAPAARTADMPWFFETFLPAQLEAMPDLAASIGRSFRFAVDGPGGGTWAVDLRPEGSRVQREAGDSQCTVMVSAADLTAISRGDLNSRKAFLDGRLRLAGQVDLGTLQKLVQLLRQPADAAAESVW
jgi:protein-tyrosine sulfotransferase